MAKAKTEQRFDELEFSFTPRKEFQDDKFCRQAAELKANGMSWDEVAEEMGSKRSLVSLAAHIHEDGRIMFRTHKELARQIQRARDAGEGWAAIGARAGGLTEGRVQALYEEATGEGYFKTYIGHGGRPRDDELGFRGLDKESHTPIINEGDGKPVRLRTGGEPKSSPKKAKAKKTKKAKTKAKAQAQGDGDLSFGDKPSKNSVSKVIKGKEITVARPGGKIATFIVEDVLKVAQNKKGDWGAKVRTDDGKEPAFALTKIRDIQ